MHCQNFVAIIFLLIFTIVHSLNLPYFFEPTDLSKYPLKKSVLQEIPSTIDGDEQTYSKWRRESSSIPRQMNVIRQNKPLPRFLKYDFLLRQWILRQGGQ